MLACLPALGPSADAKEGVLAASLKRFFLSIQMALDQVPRWGLIRAAGPPDTFNIARRAVL